MSKYSIKLSRAAAKYLKKIKNPVRNYIISSLELLAEQPYQGKVLIGPLKGKRS